MESNVFYLGMVRLIVIIIIIIIIMYALFYASRLISDLRIYGILELTPKIIGILLFFTMIIAR